MKLSRLLGLAPLALLPLLGACGKKPQPAAQAEAKPALTVEVTTPTLQAWPGLVEASGSIAPWQEASIGTELSGVRLEEVLVNVGDTVAAGQLLAHFSEDSLKAEYARLEAQVAENQAAADKARADAEGGERLGAAGALSQTELRGLRAQVAITEARLASAKAQRDAQALRLRYARVVAPDAGVISARSATVGAVATPGVEMFRLIRRGRLEWRAEVRSDALPRLTRGMRATLKLPSGQTVTGTVRQVAPAVNPQTLNGMVYVDVPARSGLAAGLFVSGSFELPATAALAVPESAIVFRNGNRYVMQLDAANRIHEVKVQAGRRHGNDLEIVEGLAPDTRIALSGGAFLNEGDLVTVASPAGAGGQTQAQAQAAAKTAQ